MQARTNQIVLLLHHLNIHFYYLLPVDLLPGDVDASPRLIDCDAGPGSAADHLVWRRG